MKNKISLNKILTYLEVDDDHSNDHSSDQVEKVWSVLSVECLLESVELVWLGQKEMEKCNNGTLKFSSLIGSNGDWGERFPEDQFADVGSNEKRDTRSETVTLLEEFIEHKDHESSKEKLSNDQERVDETKFTDWTVHS